MTIDTDSAKFSGALKSAILLPIGAIFMAAILLLILVFELFEMIKWSDHSYQVIAETRHCETLMLDMETGLRGYLIDGNSIYLEPYNEALAKVDASFEHLSSLVSDNPEQRMRMATAIQFKNTWVEYAKGTVSQHQKNVVPDEEWHRMGKKVMDQFRDASSQFISAEEGLRAVRSKRLQRMKRILLYSGSLLAVVLSVTVIMNVRLQFKKLSADYRTALITIEERHQALEYSQKKLEEQKEWFRVTLSSIGDGVIVTDREGKIVFINEESERLTGWKMADALLKPLTTVFRIVNEETRNTVENPVERVFREKRVVGLANHTVLLSRGGSEFPIEDSAAPIFGSGQEMLGVVLVFHNASEMRLAQKKLKAYSEELEKKVAERTLTLQQTISELESFSYTVSHDLRSPLRAMQGFAQAVLEDYEEKLDADGKNYLVRIKNAGERLDRLIQDLLSYTRLSRQEVPMVEVDLDKMVRDITENYPNLRPPAAEVHIESPLPKVMGKEAGLTQVISNLLGNAAKFVPSGVKPIVKIRSEDLGHACRIWVEDNGIGIADKDQERIFQMFTQVNEAQLYGGTGVGLAIVKKAVQTMHGRVGVKSTIGQGSQFWVELNKAKV